MSALLARDFDLDDNGVGNAQSLTFEPVGPVATRFINDRTFISSIMGPYGSAKTTSCFQKILNAATWQSPNPRDGVRRIRVCVIRETYGQLKDNVMKDWFAWFPKTKDNFNGETDTHTLTLSFPGLSTKTQILTAKNHVERANLINGVCVIEIIFRGLGELKAEAVFKGMQLTLLWLNEVDTLSREVLNYGLPRVGRYPAAKDGGCAWSGIIADFNAPEVDNWVYDLLVNKNLGIPDELLAQLQERYGPEFGISFHRQPGGLDPEAENLRNLSPGYYDRLIIGFSANDNKVRRFVHNEFGAVNNGQPVYPEFNDGFHVAKVFVQPIPGQPIHAGIDGGSTPAMVFGQEDELGQVRILAECVIFNDKTDVQLMKMGPRQFARLAREFVDRMWPTAKMGNIWGDPAMFTGGYEGEAAEDLSWAQDFGRVFGKNVRPAPGTRGNRVTPRIEAVRDCLVKNAGSKPGLLVSPIAKHLRRGFNNGYVIQRLSFSDGHGRYKDTPLKNDFSHVHDALQYLILGLKKRGNMTDGLDDQRRDRNRQRGNVDFGRGYFSGGGRIGDRRPARKRRAWSRHGNFDFGKRRIVKTATKRRAGRRF